MIIISNNLIIVNRWINYNSKLKETSWGRIYKSNFYKPLLGSEHVAVVAVKLS